MVHTGQWQNYKATHGHNEGWTWGPRKKQRNQRRVLHFYFYEWLAAACVEISRRSEQKIYDYDLLAPPTYCSRLSRKQWLWQKDGGNRLNVCYEKVVLSEYNSVSIINMLKHLMLKQFVCALRVVTKCYHSNERLRVSRVLHRSGSEDGS